MAMASLAMDDIYSKPILIKDTFDFLYPLVKFKYYFTYFNSVIKIQGRV